MVTWASWDPVIFSEVATLATRTVTIVYHDILIWDQFDVKQSFTMGNRKKMDHPVLLSIFACLSSHIPKSSESIYPLQ